MDQTKLLLTAKKTFTLEGPGIVPNNPVTQTENVISGVIGILTIVSVIYFVIQVIFAGLAFISSQGDEKKIESARKRLTDGILGLTIVVVAFGIGSLLAKLLNLENIFDLNAVINLLKF